MFAGYTSIKNFYLSLLLRLAKMTPANPRAIIHSILPKMPATIIPAMHATAVTAVQTMFLRFTDLLLSYLDEFCPLAVHAGHETPLPEL